MYSTLFIILMCCLHIYNVSVLKRWRYSINCDNSLLEKCKIAQNKKNNIASVNLKMILICLSTIYKNIL